MSIATQAEEDEEPNGYSYNKGCANPADCTGYLFNLCKVIMEDAPGDKPQRSIDNCPYYPSCRVIDQEGAPFHMIDARQKCCPRAQHSDEAAKEDGFVSMFGEKPSGIIEIFRL